MDGAGARHAPPPPDAVYPGRLVLLSRASLLPTASLIPDWSRSHSPSGPAQGSRPSGSFSRLGSACPSVLFPAPEIDILLQLPGQTSFPLLYGHVLSPEWGLSPSKQESDPVSAVNCNFLPGAEPVSLGLQEH